MSQGTTPANYRDTVGTDNDYFLRSKKANEYTGSTGLDPKSILFSPLPRLRMPVLQSPFNSITQRTPTQQPPEQQPQQLQQPTTTATRSTTPGTSATNPTTTAANPTTEACTL
jgi:hypothetical protein